MAKDRPRLTLSMVVKNESNRYLRQALENSRRFIDDAVIIDDGSTDDTADLCLHLLKDVPVKLIRNESSRFSNEITLRKQQWEETLSVKPDWILNLDADEWFEDAFADQVGSLLAQEEADLFCFRLYDFWNASAYREDQHWQAHHYYRPFLLRYRSDYEYVWRETVQHCGRFPENIYGLSNQLSPLRLKHFGWSAESDRIEKFQRYMRLDPEGIYGSRAQYISILDEEPHLVNWLE